MRSLHDEAKASPIPPTEKRPTLEDAIEVYRDAYARFEIASRRHMELTQQAAEAEQNVNEFACEAGHARKVLDAVIMGRPMPPERKPYGSFANRDRDADVMARLTKIANQMRGPRHLGSGMYDLGSPARDLDDDGA